MPKQYKNPLWGIFKGLIIGFALTAAVLIIYSLLLVYTSVTDVHTSTIARLTTALCTLICGFAASHGARRRGLIIGTACGALYTVLLIAAALITSEQYSFDAGSAITAAIGCIGGAIGGIAGINLGKK